jgi:pSer/pThr/pTyr-binding forkhead associated (FHA) protein
MSYTAPSWCRPPPSQHSWSIDEIKSGVLVATHTLADASTTFGRAADVVTVPTLHESCSRVHARIAFDSSGTPWLRDLSSGNGTLVNGKRMPAASIGKEVLSEAEIRRQRVGSRGVVVYPGDTIKLGASTRMYCLNGPEEFDRGAVKARMEAAKLAALNKKADGALKVESNGTATDSADDKKQDGISWGMDMSDDPAEDDVAATAAPDRPIQESDVPDKHRKLFENLRAKQHKLENALEESQRIEAKAAHADLSDGQKTRLEQNRARIEELRGKIEEAEAELKEKIWGSSASVGRKKKSLHTSSDKMNGDDDDIDDLYDKTTSRKRGRDDESGEVETEQSLSSRWKVLIADWKKKKGESSAMQRRVNQMASRVAAAEAAGDEDAFFMRNDLDLVQDNHKKLLRTLEDIEKELLETEKLLQVVNDKLVVDRSSSFIGLASDVPKAKTNDTKPDRMVMPPPPPPAMATGKGGNAMMPPPAVVMAPPPAVVMAPPPKRPSSLNTMMPPAPRPVLNDSTAMPPPPVAQSREPVKSSADMAPPPPKRGKPIGPSRSPGGGVPGGGTLAAIRSAVASSKNYGSSNASSRPNGIGAAPPPAGFARGGTSMDSKEDKWQAPADQDGSGVTRLNKKFDGRY